MFLFIYVLISFPLSHQSKAAGLDHLHFPNSKQIEQESKLCWLGSSLSSSLSYRWLAFGIVSPEVTLVLRRCSGEPWCGRASLCTQAV